MLDFPGYVYQGSTPDYLAWVDMMGRKLGTITDDNQKSKIYNISPTFSTPKIDPYIPPAPYTPSATYKAPEYVAPEEYIAPSYTKPTYDENKVESLTQRKAAPGLRSARQALQSSTGGYYENPNVKRMTLRDALAGYGMAVENVMSGASNEARSQYNNEYNIEADASKTNFNKDVEEGKLNYNNKIYKSQADFAAKTAEAEKNYQAQLEAERLNYQAQLEAGKLNYNTNYTQKMAEYQTAVQSYMAKAYGTGATKYGYETSQYDTTTPKKPPTISAVYWAPNTYEQSIYTPEKPNG
jgi:hypothetical protein